MIEAAPFPIRPDSVRPADLLGPYDGIVLDADSDRAIPGATIAASFSISYCVSARITVSMMRRGSRMPICGAISTM